MAVNQGTDLTKVVPSPEAGFNECMGTRSEVIKIYLIFHGVLYGLIFLVYMVFWVRQNCCSTEESANQEIALERQVRTVANTLVSQYGFKRVTSEYARNTLKELQLASAQIRDEAFSMKKQTRSNYYTRGSLNAEEGKNLLVRTSNLSASQEEQF